MQLSATIQRRVHDFLAANPDEAILRFAFRRPARQDLDLSKLPGAMPQLSDVKLLDYDEDTWVEKRVETAKKIQDMIRSTR